ncbi:MAG: hypothetical protein L0332_10535 [Chloroflexi bacterium]|nr:hypothetical protein [Chloroflexota bacterium]MCI0647892.1 hypothetical protein [Chloroflexota bacterium]MCI0727143.1 hypothetical protein [Chloroflexota bacterium]
MDDIWLLVIAIVLVVVGYYLLNRFRGYSPRGYDDSYRGQSPVMGNRGVYGGEDYPAGERPAYDSPAYRSSGTIGGRPAQEPGRPVIVRPASSPLRTKARQRSMGGSASRPAARQQGRSRPTHDDDDFRSGGSFGGS